MSQNITLRSLHLDGRDLRETATRIVESINESSSARLIVPINGQVFVAALQDVELADIISRAEFVVSDGISITIGRRFLGDRSVRRVPGVDLLTELCVQADKRSYRIFLLGGRPGAAERTIAVLQPKFCSLVFAAYCPPLGFEKSAQEIAEIKNRVRSFDPQLMFVAFGAPKQEHFMDEHLRDTGVPVIMAVGGSLEMIGGIVTRAPRWIRMLGMEWSFRVLMEPRRLFMRYLTTNSRFCWSLLIERVRSPSRDETHSCS